MDHTVTLVEAELETSPLGHCRAPERSIMRQTGHRSAVLVRRYIRSDPLFPENAATYAGLCRSRSGCCWRR